MSAMIQDGLDTRDNKEQWHHSRQLLATNARCEQVCTNLPYMSAR